jgi:DNA (cytosine-5)-methyltransferase 1
MEPSGEPFSGTWPRSGTTVSGTASLNETVRMLRTPTSAPWNQGGAGGEQEAQIKRLLPTPRANIAKQGLPREGNWGELRAEVMSLLPTPTATEGGYNRSPSEGAAIRPGLDRLLRSRGARTDPPSDDGSRFTGLRLSPSFVEWMIGAPPGWSDPDCPLSAMEFNSSSAGSSGNT